MSTSPNRHIVVDDTDPGIQYLGPGWSASGVTQASEGRFRLYNSTTHHEVSNTSGSSILFQFSGTSVQLFGSINNGENTSMLSWQCFVDMQLVSQITTGGATAKQRTLCQADSLPDSPHQVVVNVTTSGATLWFDSYAFTPAPSVPLADMVIKVDSNDPDISLMGSGWTRHENLWPFTSTSGDQMTFRFFGSSATFISVATGELEGNSTTGTYAVDGSPSTSFVIPGHDYPGESNQIYFSTLDFPLGLHVLTITYEGDESKAPLALESFYVTNRAGTLPSTTLSLSSTTAPMQHQPPILPVVAPSPSQAQNYRDSGNSSHAGAIAAGIVTGLVLIVAAISAFLLRLRRRAKAAEWMYRADPFTETYDARPPTSYHAGHRKLGSSEGLLDSDMTTVPAENRNFCLRPLRYGEIATPPPSRRRPLPSLPPPPPVTSPSHPFRSSLLPAHPHFVHHKDSGIRIDVPARVIDVPPTYTRE